MGSTQTGHVAVDVFVAAVDLFLHQLLSDVNAADLHQCLVQLALDPLLVAGGSIAPVLQHIVDGAPRRVRVAFDELFLLLGGNVELSRQVSPLVPEHVCEAVQTFVRQQTCMDEFRQEFNDQKTVSDFRSCLTITD